MKNNAVYISSLRKDFHGEYMPAFGTTALSNKNKVEIFGNNMDGMTIPEQIRFNLTGVQVINKDDVFLFVHACEIVENTATSPNIFLNPEAEQNGTVIKFSDTDGSSYLFNNTLDNYDTIKIPVTPKSVLIDGEQYESKGNELPSDIQHSGGRKFTFKSIPAYFGATFKIKNRLDIFAASVFFNISDTVNEYIKYVPAMLFQQSGDSLIVAIIPNKNHTPAGMVPNNFTAGISMENMEQRNTLVATDVTYFTFPENNPKILPYPKVLPYYMKSNLVEKFGTFSKGQQFVDINNKVNLVTESGTIDRDNSLSDVRVSGTVGNNFITANHSRKLTTGQYIKILGSQNYRITGCKDGNRFYLDKVLTDTFTDSTVSFKDPTISLLN